MVLRFRLNKSGLIYGLNIVPPSFDNPYHPFVSLEKLYDTVEIVHGEPLSWNYQSKKRNLFIVKSFKQND